MVNIIHRFRYKFSEPYRIRIGVGLSPIRTNREYKALIAFCKEQLEDKEVMKLNNRRKRIYAMTLRLHEFNESDEPFLVKNMVTFDGHKYYEPHSFISDYCNWYWS